MGVLNDFSLYYFLGIRHILDWGAYDHILFIIVLCSTYIYKDWRKILILVTAFTLGHSITLALWVLHILYLPSAWVEFFIPITIALTCLGNLTRAETTTPGNRISYVLAMTFGFVHGMGFASALSSLLGKESSILFPLLAFNLGLETGQILVVVAVLLSSSCILWINPWPQKFWNKALSFFIFLIALFLAYIRFPHKNI